MTRFVKLLLAVPALLLALSGCSKQSATPDAAATPVPAPARLTVTASRPAGTLDSLPDLAWSLQGNDGLSLVVRAQGPGASAPGAGFAGVRVSTGLVRYLAPDGTWSETEVAYSASAGASGTIRPTAPLRLEGEWRFDLIAKNATGSLQSFATAPVLLSSVPALRVTLSRRAAVAGDLVNGSVVLARGSTARPVRLVAWWQGPGGVADRLPHGAPLAFDGPSADVALPLLARTLDGAAPGAWSLVARLYDAATGAPLAYGEQTLQVCSGVTTLTGTVLGAGGTPLGVGASIASVSATSLSGAVGQDVAIDSTGAFTVDLMPGAWVLTGLVVDGAGAHRVDARAIQVGCAAPAPLVLSTGAPVPLPTSAAPKARSLRSPASVAAATASCPALETFDLLMDYKIKPGVSHQNPVPESVARLLLDSLAVGIRDSTSPLVRTIELSDLGRVVGLAALIESLGGVRPPLEEVAAALGREASGLLVLEPLTDSQFKMTLTVSTTKGAINIRAAERLATVSTSLAAIDELVAEVSTHPPLDSDIRAHLDYPVQPTLNIVSTFGSVLPSSQHEVVVHMKDCNNAVYVGKTVYLERRPVPFPAEVSALTDAAGDAHFTVLLGASDVDETVEAHYLRQNGSRFPSDAHKYVIQRNQTGQIQFPGVTSVIRPGGSTMLAITSRDPVTGAPQPARNIEVQSTLGGLQETSSAATDVAGAIDALVHAGPAVGLGEVKASTPASGPPPATGGNASEFLVVSSPAALSLNAALGVVRAGLPVQVAGTLHLDGIPMPGTTVTLSDAGGGTISSSTATVDDTGGFEVTFLTPVDGSGSATVTASVEVEGQTLTRNVPISWAGAAPLDRLVISLDMGGRQIRVQKVEPSSTTEIFFTSFVNQPAAFWIDTTDALYLRLQNSVVVTLRDWLDPNSLGWGIMDAAGNLDPVRPPVRNYTSESLFPGGVSHNGKYRAHQFSQTTCVPGSDGNVCTTDVTIRIYENGTNAMVGETGTVVHGRWIECLAVGPAGEILFLDNDRLNTSPGTGVWRLRPVGGGDVNLGSYVRNFLSVNCAFSSSGDRAYYQNPWALAGTTELDLATGLGRLLSVPLDFYWSTFEPGAFLGYGGSTPDGGVQLRTWDLATGTFTVVGAVASDPLPRIVP